MYFWQSCVFVQINTLKPELKGVEVKTVDCSQPGWLYSANK